MQKHRFLPTTLIAMATVVGCSSMQVNPRLNEARNNYTTAQNNPQVTTHASAELKLAGDALDKANAAAKTKEDDAVVTHLAYVAKQRVAIAEETAKQKEAELVVTNASNERNEIRLDARTEEANKAKEKAEAALRQAETSQQSAESMTREAQTSQQRAEASQREAEAARQSSEESKRQVDISQQQSATSQQQARDAEMRASQLETQMKEMQELNAKKTDRGMVITLGDVLFDTSKAELKRGSKRSLEKLAGFLKKYPDRQVQIEGYTDATGGADYNQELSERRANAVRASLLEMGVTPERITTHGYGKDSPIASNDTPAGRQMNRRVEIVFSETNDNVSSSRTTQTN